VQQPGAIRPGLLPFSALPAAAGRLVDEHRVVPADGPAHPKSLTSSLCWAYRLPDDVPLGPVPVAVDVDVDVGRPLWVASPVAVRLVFLPSVFQLMTLRAPKSVAPAMNRT
jgi:hypothetical protein